MDARTMHLAGSVLTMGIAGTAIDAETRRILERVRPSGVVLFRRNVESFEQLCALTGEIRALPWRPIVSIDHEGGRVTRVGSPFTSFPPAREVARAGDPELARAVGRAMGVELAGAGIDIDFAPVLDVDSNPHNPVIGDRSFGITARAVCSFALAFLDGLTAAGVIGCGKHFPGHGDTDLDSHTDLPTVRRDRDALDALELVPFRAAIAAGVPMLMTAHVVYPALDRDRPATLSSRIVRELLRRELGFGGVVVSDDLEMGALGAFGDVPELAVAALGAGVDWVLVCNDVDAAVRAAERIATAVARGELDERAVVTSARRIQALPRRAPAAGSALPIAAHVELASDLRSRIERRESSDVRPAPERPA